MFAFTVERGDACPLSHAMMLDVVLGFVCGLLREYFFFFITLKRSQCRANLAHLRQSRPDSGPGFRAKSLTTFQVVPSSLAADASALSPPERTRHI